MEKQAIHRTQEDEFKLALAEKRQPNCVECGKPLNVSQYQPTYTTWTWHHSRGHFVIDTEYGDSDGPYCTECGCGSWTLIEHCREAFDLGLHY